MAVAFEGFSIREYTAKMRSVDVAKCWPFTGDMMMKIRREEGEGEEQGGGDATEEAALLPPMKVVKFKWWSHELSRLRSEKSAEEEEEAEKSAAENMVCPVCRVFAAATVNAVNAHIDDCLVIADDQAAKADRRVSTKKAKSKPPKKRSITEIFAVAPQIDTIEDASEASERSEQEDDDELESDQSDKVLVDDFKVLNVTSRHCAGPTIIKKKKIMKTKKRKEKKRDDNNNNSLVVVSHKIRENNKKLKKKKKVKKNKKTVDGSIATKRNVQKFKLQNHVKFTKKLKKRFAMDILSSDSVRGKKTSTKCLSTQDKQKVVEPPKLISTNREPIFPIRSILKNHTSCELKSTIHNMQCDNEVSPCGIQQSERHVRFSGKDDILGPEKKDFCSSEQIVGNLLSDGLAMSPENVQSADNRTVAVEVNRIEDDTSMDIDCGTEAQTMIGREQSANIPHVEIQSSPRVPVPEKMQLLPEKSTAPQDGQFYENNLCSFDQGYRSPAGRPAFTCSSTLLPTFGASYGNTQLGGSVSSTFNSSGKLINHVQDPIRRVADITPRENTSQFSQPLSCFTANETANNRLQFQSQPAAELVNAHTFRCRPICHLPPMDLIGGLCSFPQWKQKAVALRERRIDEDFFGLPLNSQGELIQSSSRGKGLFDELRETNITGHSSNFLPAHNFIQPRSTGDYFSASNRHLVEREFLNDRPNVYLAQNYVKENPSFQVPARFGLTYLESTGREDVHQLDFERRNHSFQPLDADRNLMNISFDGSRKYDQLQNQKISEMNHPKENSGKISLNTSQPTMRLMGKDVPIGKSSEEMEGYEDRNVWTDKEIVVDQHCTSGSRLESSSLNRNFQEWIPQMSGGKYEGSLMQSLEIERAKPSQNHLLTKGPGSSCSHPYRDWQTNASLESSSLVANRNHGSNLFSFSHLPTSSRIFSQVPNFQDFFVSGAEPRRLGSPLSGLSTPHHSCEHVHWRPAELTHRQNVPHFTAPDFEFPFLDPDSRLNVESTWFQNSKSLPPWLLHAKQQEKIPMTSSQQSPTAASKHGHQHISSRTNILNAPSTYHSAETCSYSCSPGTSYSQMNNPLGSAAVVLPPLVPVISGVKPASSMNTGYRNRMKVKERLKTKVLGVKDLYPCKKPNKRLATRSLDLVKPARILDLEKQDKLGTLTRCTAQNLNNSIQGDMLEDDLRSNSVKAIDLECQQADAQNFGIGISANESSRVDAMTRSGPIKLSAGVKHILKPNQSMDLDSFMPIHSTIPFAAATNSSRVPEPQKKATKIYRF